MTLADIRPALRAHLLDATAIRTIVSDRVFPIQLPQGQKATSIVYSRISGLGDNHMEGASGLSRSRIQFDCWAATADAASALALLVKERLDGFRGEVGYGGNSPANRVRIQGIFFDSEREFYDDSNSMYRVSHDYLIWYEER